MTEQYVDFADTSVAIAAALPEVWRVLTEETGALFMGATFHTDWIVGHSIAFEGEWNKTRYRDKGTVERFDEPVALAFTQFSSMSGKDDAPENYDLVSIDLATDGDTTNVTMRLGKPVGVRAPEGEELGALVKNLDTILGVLKTRAEGR